MRAAAFHLLIEITLLGAVATQCATYVLQTGHLTEVRAEAVMWKHEHDVAFWQLTHRPKCAEDCFCYFSVDDVAGLPVCGGGLPLEAKCECAANDAHDQYKMSEAIRRCGPLNEKYIVTGHTTICGK